jgi:hypothetical protein
MAVCLLALMFLISLSTAQAQNNVSSIVIEENGWFFKPLWRKDDSGLRVIGFVAFANPESLVGSNIVAVWYQRPALDDGAWTAKSWMATSLPAAIKSVKSALSIPDDQDKNWGLDPSISLAVVGTLPPLKEYTKGFFAEDPVAIWINSSPNRDVIVQVLKDSGYPVADVPLEKVDATCLGDNELLARAKGVEPLLTRVTDDRLNASYDAYNAVKAACAPPSFCGPYFYVQQHCEDPTEGTIWGEDPMTDGSGGCPVGCKRFFRWLTVKCYRMRGRYCRGYAEFCQQVASYRVLQTVCRCNPTTPPEPDTPMIIDQPMVISPETPYPPAFHEDTDYAPCRRRTATTP